MGQFSARRERVIFINTLKYNPAGITERGVALIIDSIIIFTFALLFNMFFDYNVFVLAVILSYLYEIFLPLFWSGYTIGKRLLGIRIIHLTDKKLTLGTMIIRVLAHILYSATAGILTFVSIYFVATREDRRSIHDLIAQTYVTDILP